MIKFILKCVQNYFVIVNTKKRDKNGTKYEN